MYPLITPHQLAQKLNSPNFILLDASLAAAIDGSESAHAGKVIPSARFFDLKGKFSDPDAGLPNTLPSAEQFEQGCRELGIDDVSEIVIYDNRGVYSSPRVWWMFRVMGHDKVSVLDGGLPAWVEAKFETHDHHQQALAPGNFRAQRNEAWVKQYDEIRTNSQNPKFQVVDARSAGRFNGTEEEPRKNLPSGCIPHSINIPFKEVLDNGKFKSIDELQKLFNEKGVTDGNATYSCGSGLTACIVLLASVLVFGDGNYVYDGSWTEWAMRGKPIPPPH